MADAKVKYLDADGDTFELEVNDGDIGGSVTIHDVRSSALPAGAATQTTLASVLTAVDGIEALVGTTNTTLTTIDGRVDGVEGKLDGLAAQLDIVIVSINSGVSVSGQNTDIDTSSEDLGSQSCEVGAWVKNISTSNQLIYVSPNNVTATTTNGYQLSVGEERFFPCTNISQLKVISSANNAIACWLVQ